jgi:DNA invertase Pin-like site-specific DNA recombinase
VQSLSALHDGLWHDPLMHRANDWCTPSRHRCSSPRSIAWLGRTSDLYRIVSELGGKGVSFKVLDDPSIDTTSRTGKLVMGILALIAEFENDIRRERQMDGNAKAKDQGVKFGRKRELTDDRVKEIRELRESGETVPAIIKRTGFSKASIYRALS